MPQAVILDLDGVITATRHLHVQAWKRTFDEYLLMLGGGSAGPGQNLRPFDPESDYVTYVDGKPRLDGIRSFLTSRGLAIADGTESDPPEAHTVFALGAKKNAYYLALLEKEGPHVFEDAIQALTVLRDRGVPLAVVSSSKNCVAVLRKARIEDFFKVRVDGVDGTRLGLRGKPEPDYFLEAAKRLRVEAPRALIVEDAIAGVEAGKRGGFGLVIGMDRSGKNAKELREHGADQVISSLMQLIDMKQEAAA